MGYMHIENLYRKNQILAFKEVYALEKIHGTSAHISFERIETPLLFDGTKAPDTAVVKFFSGGATYDAFVGLFDLDLKDKFLATGMSKAVVFGEAYGGKLQAMRATYGPNLKFVAFDVKHGDNWLAVESAARFVASLGLDFVAYELIQTTEEALNFERDRPSRQAVKNGILEPKDQEGVVLRPPFEVTLNNGGRLIAKHKRPEFSERASKKDTEIDPEKALEYAKAEDIANEWVVPMRLNHVLDKLTGSLGREPDIKDTRLVIEAMVEDVLREGADEVSDTKENRKAISSKASALFLKTAKRS